MKAERSIPQVFRDYLAQSKNFQLFIEQPANLAVSADERIDEQNFRDRLVHTVEQIQSYEGNYKVITVSVLNETSAVLIAAHEYGVNSYIFIKDCPPISQEEINDTLGEEWFIDDQMREDAHGNLDDITILSRSGTSKVTIFSPEAELQLTRVILPGTVFAMGTLINYLHRT